MAKPNYRIKLTHAEWAKLHADPLLNAMNVNVASRVVQSERDPKLHANGNTYMIEIDDYAYGDFNNIHRQYKDAIYRIIDVPVNGAGLGRPVCSSTAR